MHKVKNFWKMSKFIGPGLLVTIGFIDPGNWATNIAAGSMFGYKLLWVVTVSTIILIILQHNVAHLGIVTGKCLAENITEHSGKIKSKLILISAMMAVVSTTLAEILGAAIAINMLTGLPLLVGSIFVSITIYILIKTNSYHKIERIIMLFVSLIGFSFIAELFLTTVNWNQALTSSFSLSAPQGSILIIISVLGAVVMPHNIFLHSETIQNQKIPNQGKDIIEERLKYEFFDTIFSMIIGWMINSAMIILAVTFYTNNIVVTELDQAQQLLVPLLGDLAALIFAFALFFAGVSSSLTAAMSGGIVSSGMFGEKYNPNQSKSIIGIFVSIIGSLLIIAFIQDSYKVLILSQTFLSIQLPITIFAQIHLTSSQKVMGQYRTKGYSRLLLIAVGVFVSTLNILLLIESVF